MMLLTIITLNFVRNMFLNFHFLKTTYSQGMTLDKT